jgi:RNA-dependent RNA polymerase
MPTVPPEVPVPATPMPEHETIIKPVIISEIEQLKTLPFSTRYLIEGLVSQALVQSYDVEVLAATVQGLTRGGDYKIVNQVLSSLFSLKRLQDLRHSIERRAAMYEQINMLTRPKKVSATDKQDNKTVMMRRAIVTPTRMLLLPEEKEQGNSVLRHFHRYQDRFLRVQFNDEHDQLQVNASVKEADAINPSAGTMARVRRALQHGLIIAGRKYVFLAASASQSKEHSCWYFAELTKSENDGQRFGVQDILDWMGNLSEEKVVAKHAARQGLVFSTTRAVNLPIKLRRPMEDTVTRSDVTDLQSKALFTFTDGVGRCAQNVADQAAKDLGFDDHDVNRHPSAIQFRLGGAKGVLCAWPTVKPRENFLRKSQIKFESDSKALHVVRIAQYRKAFLNRQFCILFAALGVDPEVIKGLIWDKAKSIIGLADRVAARRLTRKDLWMIDKTATFPIAALINAGFHKDPVVLDVCAVIERRMLAELRWHARVEVDKGVYMMGVADESGLLQEGQVFCQFHDPEDGSQDRPKVITGRCVITRAPALHPGDIRHVQAVDIPELRSLVNVIVFNVKGVRDLPNMLGGGDLDGT